MRRGASSLLLILAGCYGAGTYGTGDPGTGGDGTPEVDIGGADDGDDPAGGGDDDPGPGDLDVGGDEGDLGGGGDVEPEPEPESWLCGSCAGQGECGDADNACVRNNASGETFCAEACDAGSCPVGYYCQDLGAQFPMQCLPEGDTCRGGGGGGGGDDGGGDIGGGDGGGDVGGGGADGEYEAELQHCVDEINRYRAQHGRAALSRSADIEACAMEGAEQDSQTGQAHGHFSATGGCNGTAWAENEIPGWPLEWYGTITAVIDGGLEMMMDEGPGGGHYENMLGDYSEVGCGIFVTQGGEVWSIQDFR